MIATSLAALVLAVQDPPPAGAAPPAPPVPAHALYAPPPVRPFEPPSNVERTPAEGDGEARPWRGPLPTGVSVEAYGGQYEAQPADAEVAYLQGITAAELSMDARMGPLDGTWSLVDAGGRSVIRLVLSDPGQDLPIEGAWRPDGRPGGGPAASGRREGATLDLQLDGGGQLALSRQGDSWSGTYRDAQGRSQPVRLTR